MIVDCAHYREGVRQHETRSTSSARRLRPRVVTASSGWACFHPTDEELAEVAQAFDLPELAVEDAGALSTSVRSSRNTSDRFFLVS